jgi:hypothetical protein
LITSASTYNAQLGNKLRDIVANNQGANKDKCVSTVCCVTHASSLQILNDDPRNICREVNKHVINCFYKELKMVPFEAAMDPLLTPSDDSKAKLNTIMPILNSVHLWGRYKQKFDCENDVLFHAAPYL